MPTGDQIATAGNGDTPESVPSISDIVDGLDWQGEATEDSAPAAEATSSDTTPPSEEPAETTPAAESSEEAPTSEEKPTYFTSDELKALSWNEIQSPQFDWSRVPPEAASHLKAVQAVLTKGVQDLRKAEAELKAKAGDSETEVVTPDEDPVHKQNREIVQKALEEIGIDPATIRELQSERTYATALELAAPKAPLYLSDSTFQQKVNEAIVTDSDLARMAQSENPNAIAQAIEIASSRIELATLRGRVKDLETGEATLKAEQEKLRKHKEELNREPASAAAGRVQGGVTRAPGTSVADIVDSEWPAGAVSLIS